MEPDLPTLEHHEQGLSWLDVSCERTGSFLAREDHAPATDPRQFQVLSVVQLLSPEVKQPDATRMAIDNALMKRGL
eukprot:4821032-Prorocentrum_lima.AAC.1